MDDLGMWLRFLHTFAALWLAAGALAAAAVRAQTKRAATLPERLFGLRLAYRLVNLFSLPGAVVTGLLGLALVSSRGYSWRAGWIHASIGLWALALGLSVFYGRPHLKRLIAGAETSLAQGAPTPEFQALVARKGPARVADLMLVALVLLVLLMVFKPF